MCAGNKHTSKTNLQYVTAWERFRWKKHWSHRLACVFMPYNSNSSLLNLNVVVWYLHAAGGRWWHHSICREDIRAPHVRPNWHMRFSGNQYKKENRDTTLTFRCCRLPVSHLVPRHDIFSPTGVTGPQSSAQKRGQQLRGPAADVIWPHLGGEGNLQWGSGRDARHSIRVSPGSTDSGWTAPNGSHNWKCKSRIVYACKVSFDLYSLRLQFCMCSKSIIVLLQNQQQELILPLPHLWFL